MYGTASREQADLNLDVGDRLALQGAEQEGLNFGIQVGLEFLEGLAYEGCHG